MAVEIGRVCEKTAGRESGNFCVVLDVLNDSTVLVTGPPGLTGVRRRKCNISHIRPTVESVAIEKNATDAEVMNAMEESRLIEKLGIKPRRKAAKERKRQDTKTREKNANAGKKAKKPK